MWPFDERDWQLVIEFSGDSPEQFEKIVALEEEMDASLISGEVDGNDVGSQHVCLSRSVLTHGPRQAHVWLIFDVGRFFVRFIKSRFEASIQHAIVDEKAPVSVRCGDSRGASK